MSQQKAPAQDAPAGVLAIQNLGAQLGLGVGISSGANVVGAALPH